MYDVSNLPFLSSTSPFLTPEDTCYPNKINIQLIKKHLNMIAHLSSNQYMPKTIAE